MLVMQHAQAACSRAPKTRWVELAQLLLLLSIHATALWQHADVKSCACGATHAHHDPCCMHAEGPVGEEAAVLL